LLAGRFIPLVVDPKKENRDDRDKPKSRKDNLPSGRASFRVVRFNYQGEISEGIIRIHCQHTPAINRSGDEEARRSGNSLNTNYFAPP
jgi:hypothetical protein